MPKNVEVKIKCYFLDFKVLKKSAKLFGSGICTEFGILISSRKVLNKSAICLVLEFIQNSVFLFYHESEHALMRALTMTHHQSELS